MNANDHDSVKQCQDSLKTMQMHDPMKEIRESLKIMQMHDPMKEIRESLKVMQMHDPLKEIRESLKVMQMHDPLKEIRESLKVMQMHDPLKEIRESLKVMQMHDPMKELYKSLQAHQSIESLQSLLKEISNESWKLATDGGADISIDADGFVTTQSEKITQEELQAIAQNVLSQYPDRRAQSFEDQINRLIHEIRSLKDPTYQRLLASLIYPLIIGLILTIMTPIADFYIKDWLSSGEKRQVIKSVSKSISGTISEKSFLTRLRVVSAMSLNVRKAGSNKSDVIGNIYLGDVVEVIEKDRNWTLISWQDSESDALMQGWVFSRYLKSVK